MFIKNIEKKALVNGIEIEVNVSFKVDHDDFHPEIIDFETEKEKAEFFRKLENGDIVNKWVQVTASYKGIIGSDALGGCLVSNVKELETIIQENGMVDNAIGQLVEEIIILSKELKQFS